MQSIPANKRRIPANEEAQKKDFMWLRNAIRTRTAYKWNAMLIDPEHVANVSDIILFPTFAIRTGASAFRCYWLYLCTLVKRTHILLFDRMRCTSVLYINLVFTLCFVGIRLASPPALLLLFYITDFFLLLPLKSTHAFTSEKLYSAFFVPPFCNLSNVN